MSSAMAFLSTIGMPEIVAGIMVLALNAYVLMGGADFGGGVWDLLASGRDARSSASSSPTPSRRSGRRITFG